MFGNHAAAIAAQTIRKAGAREVRKRQAAEAEQPSKPYGEEVDEWLEKEEAVLDVAVGK